ncbi:MAG: hypothetical protein H5U24_05445 [Thioclava marina]|jgi:UreE urease accessory protein, C-terminal domain.|uniref:urease accessory protein UreE C-terminal domain-containing protein n=1 Tax=Thioclava TaxID=285107 RepID=UPI000998C511|nr:MULTISPECIES: hypothetical protein [Thioclava]TNE89694.1 MAG: hypothetical protein EP337_08820 [Paracoccaceae bacterium]MBC7144835.1 hypothetical protein [Thioclava marina]MBD3804143.1 hypothetical protein [Thioclava sp.]OOY26557.1 hypothetical protein BMI90_17140 [Thioclava sp. L04-15]TNF12681.1 MAG: hypothetical protein EP320_11370 [Paracoccaceae bacterium]
MSSTSQKSTLIELRGDLVRAALCIGRFHAPCQIEPDRLLVMADPALSAALSDLGLALTPVDEGFVPSDLPASCTPARRVVTHGSHATEEDEDGEADLPSGPSSNA